jgi:hypothetical protein
MAIINPFESIVREAMAGLGRDKRRTADNAALVKAVAARLPTLDPDAEQIKKAKRAINACTRPNKTQLDGQLALPFMQPYGYEPFRLVRNFDGTRLIENNKALHDMKSADTQRSLMNVRRVQVHYDRKDAESKLLSAWTIEQLEKGRDPLELTWETCITEKGLRRSGSPEPEPADDLDDEDEDDDDDDPDGRGFGV